MIRTIIAVYSLTVFIPIIFSSADFQNNEDNTGLFVTSPRGTESKENDKRYSKTPPHHGRPAGGPPRWGREIIKANQGQRKQRIGSTSGYLKEDLSKYELRHPVKRYSKTPPHHGRPAAGPTRQGREIIKANQGQRKQRIGSTSGYLKEDLSKYELRHPVKMYSKTPPHHGRPAAGPTRPGREIIKANQGQRKQTIVSTSGYLKEDLSKYEVSRPDGDISNANLRHPVKRYSKTAPHDGRQPPSPRGRREIIKANQGQRKQTIGTTSAYLKEDLSRYELSRPDGDISNANLRHPVKRYSKTPPGRPAAGPPRWGREIIKANQGQRKQTIGSTSGYLKEDLSKYELSRPDGDISNANLPHPVKRYSKTAPPDGRPPAGPPRGRREIIKANQGQRKQTIGSTSAYLKEDLSRYELSRSDGGISNANRRHPVKRLSKMYSKNEPPRVGREIIKGNQGQRRQTIGSTSGYLKEDLSRHEVSRQDGDIFHVDLRHPVKESKKSLDYPPRWGREVPESANTNIQSVQQQQQRNDKRSQVTRGEPITLQWCLNQDMYSLTRPEQLECLRLMLGAIHTFLIPL